MQSDFFLDIMFWVYLIACCVGGIIDAQLLVLNPDESLSSSQQKQSLNTQETGSKSALQRSQNLSAPSPPNIAPYSIGGGGGKVSDLTITWTPLKPEEQNGPGIFYKIFWKRKDSKDDFQSLELKELGNTRKAVVKIPFEDYYTQYVVKVQAINDIGAGPISPEHIIYSAEDWPTVAPQSVIAKSFNSTTLNISWVPVEETRDTIRGKLIGHRVSILKS